MKKFMYLGIDLGTSSVKIVLINDTQQVIGTATHPLAISRPKPLHSEQDPNDWWQATHSAMMNLKQKFGQELSMVKVIGLSGQMHGATLLNDQDQPLRPAILWNDGRAFKECELLLERCPEALSITGNQVMPAFSAPKVLWVARHEPEIFSKIHKVLLPKDYLRLKMTGEYATDLSDASGTSWLNVKERRWSSEMIDATGIQINQLPKLYEGVEVTGQLLPAIAAEWGIQGTCQVVAGGGDNAASAISMGVTEPGQAFLSIGTSGVYFVADDHFRSNPKDTLHTMCHCLPHRWHQMSVHLSAANCLDWIARMVGQSDIKQLIDSAKNHRPDQLPVFLPYLSGERTPHNDPFAKGAFIGLTHDTGPAELVQAVLEGVAFSFAQGQRVIQHAGLPVNSLSVIGGGARNPYWGEIIANVLNQTLIYRKQAAVGGAFGAARLAWYSHHGGDYQTAFPPEEIEYTIVPTNNQRYQQRQQIFDQLYHQLKPTFLKLHQETKKYV